MTVVEVVVCYHEPVTVDWYIIDYSGCLNHPCVDFGCCNYDEGYFVSDSCIAEHCFSNCCTAVHSGDNSCSGSVDCCGGLNNHVADSYAGSYRTVDNYVNVAHDAN